MKNGSFHAAVVAEPQRISLERRKLPDPLPHQVRVRLEGCGVCGSNLPVWEGRPWFQYPFAAGSPGHEGWGVVDAAGGEVSECRVGDRVALLSYNAFAEVDVADAANVVKIPEVLAGQPFPGEALGCAMNVFRRADVQPDQWVAIIGIGFLGAVLADLVAKTGARVIAISRRPFALETARRLGVTHTIPLEDHQAILAEVKALTGGNGCERVFEATGLQWPLDLAGELCAERGRLIIAGYHQDGPRQVNMQLWNWRGLDVINAHERSPKAYVEGMRMAAAAVARGQLDPAPLYTHRFRLDQLADARGAMQAREESFLKALITYD
jgi:threonine dehydrogenase-like Zn-dependent dehydrogenase